MNNTVTLNNGIQMPSIGLGVWAMARGNETEQAVLWALEAGYRHIDTAKVYLNEKEVGDAIRKSGIPRNEIFVTTKLWNDDQGYESALAAINKSLERLGIDYVDQYLIHWPDLSWAKAKLNEPNKRKESWLAMEEIYKANKARSIGVSNYTIEHLEEMNSYAKIKPAANQIEFNPFLYRKELMEYCHKNKIAVVDYCPLVRGKKLNDEHLTSIAKKYNKTNAQILIRWGIEHGNVVIPKSSKKERIIENGHVFDFKLSAEDMQVLDGLNENLSIVLN